VSITPNTASLQVNGTQQLTTTARDASGNVLTGRSVTWSTANPAVATVSTNGLVTAVAPGSVAISARIDNATASASINVAAAATCGVPNLSGTITVSGVMPPSGCNYTYISNNAKVLLAEVSSTLFNPYLLFGPISGVTWGYNVTNSGTLSIELMIPGNVQMQAGGTNAGSGAFSLRITEIETDVSNCNRTKAAIKGASWSRNIATTDCLDQVFYYDAVNIRLAAGETITIDMTSNAFDAYLELYNSSGQRVAANNDGGGGTNARISFTAGAAERFTVWASTFRSGATGAYTLSIR
jgi:hypothetical protein